MNIVQPNWNSVSSLEEENIYNSAYIALSLFHQYRYYMDTCKRFATASLIISFILCVITTFSCLSCVILLLNMFCLGFVLFISWFATFLGSILVQIRFFTVVIISCVTYSEIQCFDKHHFTGYSHGHGNDSVFRREYNSPGEVVNVVHTIKTRLE